MIKQILRLLCFTQIAFTQLVFAQTDLPMYGPYLPKQPAKKTKYICALAAVENSTGENLTSVYWDNKKMTNEANFNVSIKQLKYLISKKTCQHKIQTCRVIGENGKSAISIDGNPATPFSDNPTSTAGDMKLLKDATICNFEEPTYSVLTSDSRFAVYVDGNRARPFMANARLADEDLKKFIKAFNNNSDAIPSVATPTTTSKPPLVKQKINSEKTELNKLKNVQCWK